MKGNDPFRLTTDSDVETGSVGLTTVGSVGWTTLGSEFTAVLVTGSVGLVGDTGFIGLVLLSGSGGTVYFNPSKLH